jgi:3-isopropylmalate/(R)-2-methylmalate dehydratase large subunit
MPKTLYDKVFERHVVRELPSGQYQLLMGLHLIHEVTSPQAFAMLRERGLRVMFPERTFATVDHIVPTSSLLRPYQDGMAELMLASLERSVRDFGIRFFSPESSENGIVHVIGPERGLTQPGMTICCGDSHTATHGAFGALAFGIGTSQIRDVLATQTLAMNKLKVRRIEVSGVLSPGVYAKDVILHLIHRLGVNGGVGYAYEYAGDLFDRFSMDERMTVCNMSIEGGARCGYVNPDETTFSYLRGRERAPQGDAFERAIRWWRSIASPPGARCADRVQLDGAAIPPTVTFGINPGQSVGVDERIPRPEDLPADERASLEEALAYMDLREAARVARQGRVAPGVKALVVPGSQAVARMAAAEGLPEIFRAAGFEWREAGCSMCLAMNPDKLVGNQMCASSSNRNFKGRQGSPTGRTLLMSPAMVAAAALRGRVIDARELL